MNTSKIVASSQFLSNGKNIYENYKKFIGYVDERNDRFYLSIENEDGR